MVLRVGDRLVGRRASGCRDDFGIIQDDGMKLGDMGCSERSILVGLGVCVSRWAVFARLCHHG